MVREFNGLGDKSRATKEEKDWHLRRGVPVGQEKEGCGTRELRKKNEMVPGGKGSSNEPGPQPFSAKKNDWGVAGEAAWGLWGKGRHRTRIQQNGREPEGPQL